MKLTLGTNIAARQALRSLNNTSAKIATVYERLSSGMRINHASDDAAGLAVASALTSDARVFNQGIRNANDAISMLSMADAALTALSEIVNRQQELATQAANGTYTDGQRRLMHLEANALVDEFNRIVATTSYNDIGLLNDPTRSISIQVGYDSILNNLGSEADRTAGSGTFQTATSIAAGNATLYDSTSADFNNDGHMDYAISFSGAVQTFLGNGNGTFRAPISVPQTASSKYYIDHADVNQDGKEDLMVPDSTGATFSVMLGNGDGTFNSAVSYSSGVSTTLYRSFFGDFNNDGSADVVSVGRPGGTTRVGISLANADGTFNAASSFVPAGISNTDTVAVGDFDADGNQDLVIGDFSSGNLMVFYGNGNGTFGGGTTYSSGTSVAGRVYAGDVNNDGIKDIIAADTTNQLAHVFIANGDRTFNRTSYSAGLAITAETADLNGDGINDIAVTDGSGGRVQVLLNNGDGTFGAKVTYNIAAGTANGISTGDYNEDGALDIIAPSVGAAQVSLLLGNTRQTTTQAHMDLSTQELAAAALSDLSETAERLSLERGAVGGLQSRMSIALNHLQATSIIYSEAASRITDADVAFEAAELARLNILQKAATAVLAQANQQPEIVLRLIGVNKG